MRHLHGYAAALVAWLICSLSAHAQQPALERFGLDAGLTNQATGCLEKDSAGYLWICSENGLFRFDGQRFHRFGAQAGLGDLWVVGAFAGRDGQLWVATQNGLYLRGPNNRFTAVSQQGKDIQVIRRKHGLLPAPDRASDTLFIDRGGQLLRLRPAEGKGQWDVQPFFDAETLRQWPELGQLAAMARAPDGTLWLACGRQLCEWRRSQLRRWEPPQGVAEQTWTALVFDAAGSLWVRSDDHLIVLEAGAAQFVHRDPPNSRISTSKSWKPLANDGRGGMLVRNNDGVALWRDGRWRNFGPENGLGSEVVSDLLVDDDGAIWMSRIGGGLDRWMGYGVTESWTASQGLVGNTVRGVARAPDGELLVGGGRGCFSIKPGSRQLRRCDFQGLPVGESHIAIDRTDGSAYIGITNRGLFRTDAITRTAHRYTGRPLELALGMGMTMDFFLQPEEGRPRAPRQPDPSDPLEKLPSAVVMDTARAPNGDLWLAATDGLYRWRDGRWSLVAAATGRAKGGYYSVAALANGDVWASTTESVLKLQASAGPVHQQEWLDTPLMREVAVMFVRGDARGWVWIGTDHGMVFSDGKGWHLLDVSGGLVSNDVNTSGFLADTDGSVWIGTNGGLTHIADPRKLLDSQPLRLRLDRMVYGDRPIIDGATPLPWDRDSALEVTLSAFPLQDAKGLRMRYRVVGLSETWQERDLSEINMPSLHPGHYRLEVQALLPATAQASPVVHRSFTVTPPWWQDPAFMSLMAGLTGLVGWWVARKWSQRQRHRQRELERLLDRATRDPLTRLWNRATVIDRLELALHQAQESGSTVAIALIDIDHFKRVNDTHGHLAGDAVLRGIASVLDSGSRQGDALGRYGGEELLLVMPGLAAQRPSAVVDRIQGLARQARFPFEGLELQVTVSIGVAWSTPHHTTAEALIGRADAALYAAKHQGRDRVCYADMLPDPAR